MFSHSDIMVDVLHGCMINMNPSFIVFILCSPPPRKYRTRVWVSEDVHFTFRIEKIGRAEISDDHHPRPKTARLKREEGSNLLS